ncbi:MAG: OsmC family protein [Xanthomonadales bacterium]|nr:OsmC family protein [Xanthomonadales bacterium]
MQALPHNYQVNASSSINHSVILTSTGLPALETDAPAEFGGPGDLWSPETMLVGAIANCFILSFRAVAAASKMDWEKIDCDVEAVLERVERVTRFTRVILKVKLLVNDNDKREQAEKLLDKSKSICLITNSMSAEVVMEKIIITG